MAMEIILLDQRLTHALQVLELQGMIYSDAKIMTMMVGPMQTMTALAMTVCLGGAS